MNELEKDYFNDLKEYGKGYSYDQLKRMSMFANVFSDLEIRAQAVPKSHGEQYL